LLLVVLVLVPPNTNEKAPGIWMQDSRGMSFVHVFSIQNCIEKFGGRIIEVLGPRPLYGAAFFLSRFLM
jgi:hypothetical protein